MQYLDDQRAATTSLPDDKTLVLERTRDEMGDWRLVLLSPWGGRIHAPWTIALAAHLRDRGELELESVWSDDGIVLRLPERERPPEAAELLPPADAIEDLVVRELPATSLFAAHFREAAARALLLPRRRPGQRSPLWMQRKRAHELLQIAARYPSFPIVLEAARECLGDVFDVPALVELARAVERREVRLVTVDTQAPSPFASSLLFGYVANYLYDGDAPLAERRAQALSVDTAQLQELVGGAELRELVDREALADLELALQALGEGRGAASADAVHDLLRRLGDLSLAEIAARARPRRGAGAGGGREGLARHAGLGSAGDRGARRRRGALRGRRGRGSPARRARHVAPRGTAAGLPRAAAARAPRPRRALRAHPWPIPRRARRRGDSESRKRRWRWRSPHSCATSACFRESSVPAATASSGAVRTC